MEMLRQFLWLDQFILFGIDIAAYIGGLTKKGVMNEEFPNSQKLIPLSLAQKENRKSKGFKGVKHT